ncbi:hypothetical protein E3N88_37916 [Mikania micrantha]|uniref:Uncharacterized protein n=1 Tax=Mikania micrantha TaxID=192012 RepID=A0A5N6LSL5_9ASTR|nr:hypothetical protein E3N88_37916 [Mikania micrantha]
MVSILRRGGLALALIILVVISSSFRTISVADARSPYNRVRQLADCNSPIQGEVAGCGGGGGTGGSPRPRPRPRSSSSRCKKGCCGKNKLGECICCK